MNDAAIIDIVRATREILLPHYGTVAGREKHGASGITTVTDLDLEVERFLQDKLTALEPEIGFAGEEFGGSRESDRYWLCDPIDGTVHFIRGLPFCTVQLALIEEGRVNFAAIYDFVSDKLYHARRSEGAYVNDKPIHVSDRPIEQAYLAVETHFRKPENVALLQRIRAQANLIEIVTSGYEFVLVASGKIEGRVSYDPYGFDYDFAPGTLLVEEAGGIVANIGSLSYDLKNLDLIAANPKVFGSLTNGDDAPFPISS